MTNVSRKFLGALVPWWFICVFATICIFARASLAIDQAMPSKSVDPHAVEGGLRMPPGHPSLSADTPVAPQDRSAFREKVHLDDLRLLAIQHRDQLKIFDSWARQSNVTIRNWSTIEGDGGGDPLYTALDIAFRPEAWYTSNIIYIQAIPIRQEFARLAANQTEAARIMHDGLVSPQFIEHPEVFDLLSNLRLDTRLLNAVNKIQAAYETYRNLWATLAFVPPAASQRNSPWLLARELKPNYPEGLAELTRAGAKDIAPIPGYSVETARSIALAYRQLADGSRTGDADLVNVAITSLSQILPNIDPDGYPTLAKRKTELWYNRTSYGTVANVFLYFAAMTLFLLAAIGTAGGGKKLWRWAYPIFTLAVILHIASMAVRMWLAGRWPTQNQFESVLGAALLGCIVGWLLETRKKNALFGMAFSFVGFLAMTACMAAPYMFGNDLGGAISKTAGILQTYWLYIHVNIVIASYALISASFLLGLVYLLVKLWHWINPLEQSSEFLVLSSKSPAPHSELRTQNSELLLRTQDSELRTQTLATLDQANMVILQMAFWFLGIGIVCGAVWADHSWGRPWGWDPKETFALVTWIVYLIIVHVRLVLPKLKADATAAMSIAGFAIMLFNWIGVNYFLAGLHSYA